MVSVAAAMFVFVVVQVAIAGGADRGSGAQTSASVTKQIKNLKQRIAALEAKPDQVGQVPASLPPSGLAGGELAGSYPNPTVGTVAGLDLVESTASTAGINFGPNNRLFRSAAGMLSTSTGVGLTASNLTAMGEVNAATGLTSPLIQVPELTGSIILPQADRAILYTIDVAGKTRLVAQFPSGGLITIATEP